MKKNVMLMGGGTLLGLTVIVAVLGSIWLLNQSNVEAAVTPAEQTATALGKVRATGSTIVCGSFHEPRILSGVPVKFEDNFIFFQDGYQLYVKEPFSFYAGKYHGFQIDDGKIVQSVLVGSENYYPCPINQETAAPSP